MFSISLLLRFHKLILLILLIFLFVLFTTYRSGVNIRDMGSLELPKIIYPPQQLHYDQNERVLKQEHHELDMKAARSCQMHSCFNYSSCGLTSGFPIYLYDPDEFNVLHAGYKIDEFLKSTIKQTFEQSSYIVEDPQLACIYLVLVGEGLAGSQNTSHTKAGIEHNAIDIEKLYHLPYWHKDGHNHVLLNFAQRDLNSKATNMLQSVNTMRAIVVQSTFKLEQFRPNYDLVVPPLHMVTSFKGNIWEECAPMVPAQRTFLLSFQGELNSNEVPHRMNPLDELVLQSLIDMSKDRIQDTFLFNFECDDTAQDTNAPIDWQLCGTYSSRKSILHNSTFTLILPPPEQRRSSILMLARLSEALCSGAIPVILGADEVRLPYDETIDWRRIALLLPKARAAELHLLLSNIQNADILEMRRRGRYIWERYLSTVQATVNTIIATFRDRLGIPPHPMPPVVAQGAFNNSFAPLTSNSVNTSFVPNEFSKLIHPLPEFRRNFTLLRMQSHEVWNDWVDPFYMYPQTPFDPVLPAEAKFIGPSEGFRSIDRMNTSTGEKLIQLGVNYPQELFTIVILTYKREKRLMLTLKELFGLQYLHKVVVVWNSPTPPADDLKWPDIGVPIAVVRVTRNSLNNRFLPFDIIETDAVFSMDDDINLKKHILFCFRVWRANRDQIVGFPGRFITWNFKRNHWNYHSMYSQSNNLVLTGAAFMHKYYMYLYTYYLPQVIRDKVDQLMNCEDIAMNFLVAHITRKPPLCMNKTYAFHSPAQNPLSFLGDHYTKRTSCINFFTQVFGYTPLLNTPYAATKIIR